QFGARGQLVGGGVHRRHRREKGLGEQDGLQDLHPDGAVRDGQRRLPRLGERRRDLGGRAHGVDGLHHAAERGRLVGEFVQVAVAAAAESGRGDLAADGEDGGGGGRRLLERGQRGERAGAGGQQQRGRLAGDAAVRVGGEAGVVLHPQ